MASLAPVTSKIQFCSTTSQKPSEGVCQATEKMQSIRPPSMPVKEDIIDIIHRAAIEKAPLKRIVNHMGIRTEIDIPWYEPFMFDSLNSSRCVEILELLLAYEADLNIKHYRNNTTLLYELFKMFSAYSTLESFLPKLEFILKNTNNLNDACTTEKQGILHLLIEKRLFTNASSTKSIVDRLLNHQLNIDLMDGDGFTPLLKAIYYDETEGAIYLVGKGANVSKTTYDGITVLTLARSQENQKVAQILQLAGVEDRNEEKKESRLLTIFRAIKDINDAQRANATKTKPYYSKNTKTAPKPPYPEKS